MSGFEAYKIYTSLFIHFTQKNYYYNKRNIIPVKFETYYSSKNYHIFEYNLSKYSQDDLEQLIVSNFVHNENISPNNLKNKMAIKIKNKWFETLEHADDLFVSELLHLMEKYNIENPLKLFQTIQQNISQQVCSDIIRVNSINEVIEDDLPMNSFKNNDFFVDFSKRDYHFLIVLDELMKKHYEYSFLEDFIDKNKNIKKHRLIFCLKYKRLLNINDLLKQEKILRFERCL